MARRTFTDHKTDRQTEIVQPGHLHVGWNSLRIIFACYSVNRLSGPGGSCCTV